MYKSNFQILVFRGDILSKCLPMEWLALPYPIVNSLLQTTTLYILSYPQPLPCDRAFIPWKCPFIPCDRPFIPWDRSFIPCDCPFIPRNCLFIPRNCSFIPCDCSFIPHDCSFIPCDRAFILVNMIKLS